MRCRVGEHGYIWDDVTMPKPAGHIAWCLGYLCFDRFSGRRTVHLIPVSTHVLTMDSFIRFKAALKPRSWTHPNRTRRIPVAVLVYGVARPKRPKLRMAYSERKPALCKPMPPSGHLHLCVQPHGSLPAPCCSVRRRCSFSSWSGRPPSLTASTLWRSAHGPSAELDTPKSRAADAHQDS